MPIQTFTNHNGIKILIQTVPPVVIDCIRLLRSDVKPIVRHRRPQRIHRKVILFDVRLYAGLLALRQVSAALQDGGSIRTNEELRRLGFGKLFVTSMNMHRLDCTERGEVKVVIANFVWRVLRHGLSRHELDVVLQTTHGNRRLDVIHIRRKNLVFRGH